MLQRGLAELRVGAARLGGSGPRGEAGDGWGEVYGWGPLVGTDCFSLVNDFRKLPGKYGLTSGQVITIVWEATAQPGYRDCFGAVRCISPPRWPSRLGSPFPSQQPRWPPGSAPPPSPHVHKVTRPCCTRATAGTSLPSHRQQPPQPSALEEQQKGRLGGDQNTRQILPEGARQSPPPEGTKPRARVPPGERGFPWEECEKSTVRGGCFHRLCPSSCAIGAVCVGWGCTEARTSPGTGRALNASRGCHGGVTGLVESLSPTTGLAHPPRGPLAWLAAPQSRETKHDSCPSVSASISRLMPVPASPCHQCHACPQAGVPICGLETWPGVTAGAAGVGTE